MFVVDARRVSDGRGRCYFGGERDGEGRGLLRRVADALHPVPAKPAAGLQGCGKCGALVRVGAAVLGAPDGGGGFPFAGAGVESAEAAAGHLCCYSVRRDFLWNRFGVR